MTHKMDIHNYIAVHRKLADLSLAPSKKIERDLVKEVVPIQEQRNDIWKRGTSYEAPREGFQEQRNDILKRGSSYEEPRDGFKEQRNGFQAQEDGKCTYSVVL